MVITDLGVLRPHPVTGELVLVAVHPGVSAAEVADTTGWELAVAADLRTTAPPTPEELSVLRELKERTRRAHAVSPPAPDRA